MGGGKWAISMKPHQFVKYLLHTNHQDKKVSAIKGLKDGSLIYSRGIDVIELLRSSFISKGDKSNIRLMMQKSRCSQRLNEF
ncbi:hypothetical protein [Vibrio splendidus]|uniref:hypothetical protein n=1 Tax=Vibrio splendidus TaxID=29497 RepID=UPI00148E2FE7|nr:hypothetical protein [Vibrio splendidus]NOJ06842.1 hypothetical protein [Vibrio splendidus]